jgi:hypothetical protein
MFNLWPKKKSVDEILEDVNTTCLGLTWIPEDSAKKDADIIQSWVWKPTQTPSMLQAQNDIIDNLIKENNKLRECTDNLREQQEFLYKENEDLKKILENIEEDGTYEHNNAIKLREENVKLKGELETVELEFNLVLEINNDLNKKLIGLNHLKEENVQLMKRVNEIDSDMNEEYRAEVFRLRNDNAIWKAKHQVIQNDYKMCTEQRDEYKHQLNAANKEIEALKKDIKDYVFDKSEEFDKLKKELNHMKAVAEGAISLCDLSDKTEKQKHPMYPIQWGGLDPDILKQAKEQSIEEIVEHLKGIKTQGFEDYDPRDFVESEIKNKDPLEGKQIKKDKEFSSEVLLKRVTEYANSLPKTFPNEFQEETTAENLEEKFDKGEDVLDYFEKPWQCPCNKCKETKSEKTWEEAASDLALRVVKLEKQIEELKIVNTTIPFSAMNPDGTLKTINCSTTQPYKN